MSAISPTCLPWQTHDDYEIEGRTTILGNVDGEIHSDGSRTYTYDFVARTLDLDDDSQSHSIAIANADFIVRACNSHADLLEALKLCIPANVCLTNSNIRDDMAVPLDVPMGSLRKIAAAIAKASKV